MTRLVPPQISGLCNLSQALARYRRGRAFRRFRGRHVENGFEPRKAGRSPGDWELFGKGLKGLKKAGVQSRGRVECSLAFGTTPVVQYLKFSILCYMTGLLPFIHDRGMK